MYQQDKINQGGNQQVIRSEGVAQQHKLAGQIDDNRGGAVQLQQLSQGMGQSPLVQRQAVQQGLMADGAVQRRVEAAPNRTGLPDGLKSGMENLSGFNLDHVRVHRGSSKPAAVQAHAYAQGSDIHLASGQEKHLPHELGHVVQQMQGRVRANTSVNGVGVNDDAGLEGDATRMGAGALQRVSVGAGSSNVTSGRGLSPEIIDNRAVSTSHRNVTSLASESSYRQIQDAEIHMCKRDTQARLKYGVTQLTKISTEMGEVELTELMNQNADDTPVKLQEILKCLTKYLTTNEDDKVEQQIRQVLKLIDQRETFRWSEAGLGEEQLKTMKRDSVYTWMDEKINENVKEYYIDKMQSIARYEDFCNLLNQQSTRRITKLCGRNNTIGISTDVGKRLLENMRVLCAIIMKGHGLKENNKHKKDQITLIENDIILAQGAEAQIKSAYPNQALIRMGPVRTGRYGSVGTQSEIRTGLLGARMSGEESSGTMAIVKELGKGWHSGHLVANILGGKDTGANYVPQTEHFNISVMLPLEKKVRETYLETGNVMFYSVAVTSWKSDEKTERDYLIPTEISMIVAKLKTEKGDVASDQIEDYSRTANQKTYTLDTGG